MLFTSQTSTNPGRKYLKCQFGSCRSGLQWLDEALLGVSQPNGCFNCGCIGHWVKDCPWVDSQCKTAGCPGKRILRSSKQQLTYGWRFLKCYCCGDFQWLKDAEKENEKLATIRDDPTVSINMKLSDFCNAFNSTRI
ncbi:cycloartenol synthase [Ranunculus cassubicifolius]